MTDIGLQWFDRHGWLQGTIPQECVDDCSRPGRRDEDAMFWREKLGFTVPRDLAIPYLRETGAWSPEELAEFSDERLAETVLWIACGDIRSDGEWFGLVH